MGFVNTPISFPIPPTAFHLKTGTWTHAAGAIAGTIAVHKAATAETTVITIPILNPTNLNAAYNKGFYLTSIEVDYELLVAAATSVTAVIQRVARGADTAVAVVTAPAFTQAPTAANSKTQDQHRLVCTLTTPEWVDDDVYLTLELTIVCGASITIDMLWAVAQGIIKL